MPGVPTRHEDVNIVIIRENTEGEYSGLEHEVVPDVVESVKVITAEKSRRAAEYAFAHCRVNHRPGVHVIHKANIMKLTDGREGGGGGRGGGRHPTCLYRCTLTTRPFLPP